jgi:methylmalonyl-CoA mutase
MLKYHIQTSGRSLHAQEIQFNDIRTTLQALYAPLRQLQQPAHQRLRRGDHDTQTESVRRAVAIQMIINKELGLNFNENPWQGSFLIEELTDLVEEAVYRSSTGFPNAAACWARWTRCTSAARSRTRRG